MGGSTPRTVVAVPTPNLRDLLAAGLIRNGDTLVYKTRHYGPVRATLQDDATLTVDGQRFKTLSAAACHAAKVGAADGWIKWRLERTGERMVEVRDRLSS